MSRPVLAACLCAMLSACTTRPPQTVPLPPSPPSGEPSSLIGASVTDLRGRFGTPAFVRKENGAEMWRYDGAGCHAFFFLYSQDGAEIVRHVETIPRGSASAADTRCLSALRRPIS